MNRRLHEFAADYAPDHRLRDAYSEANLLDEAGLEALCPSYVELSEVAVRYRDEELIGRGAVKDVYRTHDSRARRMVAMARLREDRGPDFYDAFVHEAWLTSSLNHPNIIKVYDVGVDGDGRPYFTMDLKGNTTLADLTGPYRAADLRDLLAVLLKVCDAVAYAHSRGIIHLDLKPENIQTDEFGEVLVCDWGLGRMLTESGETDTLLSPPGPGEGSWTGEIKGSPGYMAPEQVKPGLARSHLSDIYALGCLLHLVLAGQPPFTGPADLVLEATARGEIVPPSIRFPERNIPPGLEAVMMKATATQPENRYQSARELCDEIRKYMRGFATRAEQPGFLRETRLFISRNHVPVGVAAVALIVVTVLSVLFIQRLGRQRLETAAQRERASRMESKAESLAALYQGEVEEAAETRAKLARRLATSANSLKNLGVFSSPLRTVGEAGQLVDMALILDPSCEHARLEGFTLDCITLNFAAALKNLPSDHFRLSIYRQFCEAFPQFSFTRDRRPSIEELSGFFRQAASINPDCGPLMERVLTYDMATRPNPQRAAPAVFSFLTYVNGGGEDLICHLNPHESSLLVKSGRDISLRMPESWGASGRSLLRFLTFRSLTLELGGGFALGDLDQLPIETLDVSGCGKVDFSQPVTLPQLREIRLRSDQMDRNLLVRRIRTTKEFEIVEIDDPR